MPSPILIQFTGAQSSGKTSLVNELKLLSKVPYSIINEVPRELFATSTIANLDVKATSMEQLIIQQEFLLERYRVLGENKPLILSCRSPIDVIAYANRLQVQSNLQTYVLSAAEKFIKYTLNRRDVTVYTFYTEPLGTFEEDGVRNKNSNQDIDTEILAVLSFYRVPYISLGRDTLPERLKVIEKAVGMYNLFNF